MDSFFDISPLNWLGVLCALLSGAIIGLERQLAGKPVGIRTSALICLGTYTFVVISGVVSTTATDPSRVIGQVITGIGFLGAGVMMNRDGIVLGVTSAASIWMLAAIGVVVGTQHYGAGIKMALITVAVLIGMDFLETTFRVLQKGVHKRRVLKNPEGQ